MKIEIDEEIVAIAGKFMPNDLSFQKWSNDTLMLALGDLHAQYRERQRKAKIDELMRGVGITHEQIDQLVERSQYDRSRPGTKKLERIRAIRTLTGLGLSAAKALTEKLFPED